MILRPVSPASAAGQAHDERTCRIDEHAVVVVLHRIPQHLIEHRLDHVLPQILAQCLLRDLGIMLCGDEHGIDAQRPVLLVVFNGYLRLAVGAQELHLAVLTHLCEPICQAMCQMDRQWHEHIGFVACITEHDTLVARSLCLVALLARDGVLPVQVDPGNTLVDFRALFAQ